jgi:hypothetical protein
VSKRLAVLAVVGLGIVSSGALEGASSSSGETSPVAVYPTAGTPVASPETQISFRGTSPSSLGAVQVVGSKTGTHTGVLKAHSDGEGASFVPATAFSPGETVTVRAGAALVDASNGAVTFKIARLPSAGKAPKLLSDPGGNPSGAQHFHSRHDLTPPSLRVLKRSSSAAPGDVFLGVKAGPGADGTAIYDGAGRLVWFRRVPKHSSAFDFRVQQFKGRPVLTWWQGRAVFPGQGRGAGMIYDSSYRRIATVKAGNGYVADFHEFQLTPQGTAFVIAYQPVKWDLSPAHGSSKGVAVDSVVQEIDVDTGLVEREWHSLGQVGVQDAVVKPSSNTPFDAFHANSVEPDTSGNWLISLRNTNAAYEVDPTTGNPLWTLGGKHSTFKMGHGARFIGQHDVRRAPNGDITVFDNGTNGRKEGRPSRALELAVDLNAKTASVVHAFEHPHAVQRAFSQGGVRTLANGNLFVGWGGASPYVTEFSKTGKVVFDARMKPSGDDSYRAFRIPWSAAVPTSPPDVAASSGPGKTTAFASWNGATGVASWQLLAGSDAGSLSPAGSAPSTGFETTLRLTTEQKYVQVRALDGSGHVLGTSRTIRVKSE